MSTALTIDSSLPRNRKVQVFSGILLAKNQDTDDFTTAIPMSAGSGVPTHSAAVVNEVYVRTDATTGKTTFYRATDTAGTWKSVVGSDLAYAAVAAGTLGPTGGTAETTLQSYELAANTIKAGTVVRVRATIRATAQTSTTTLTVKLKLGSTAIVTISAFDMGASDIIRLDMEITGRAAPGATAAVVVTGLATGTAAGSAVNNAIVLAPANYATNGALTLALTGQFSASDANAVASDQFVVWIDD